MTSEEIRFIRNAPEIGDADFAKTKALWEIAYQLARQVELQEQHTFAIQRTADLAERLADAETVEEAISETIQGVMPTLRTKPTRKARTEDVQQGHTPFNEVLRRIREHLGLSRAEVARRIKMDRGNYSKLENGHLRAPDFPAVRVIASEGLKLDPDSGEWHMLFSSAAKDRFQTVTVDGVTYLGYKNHLHDPLLPGLGFAK